MSGVALLQAPLFLSLELQSKVFHEIEMPVCDVAVPTDEDLNFT